MCAALYDYLERRRRHLDAVWMLSSDQKSYQITFHAAFGLTSDRILQDLTELGIGRHNDTKIVVLPITLILEGRHTRPTFEELRYVSDAEVQNSVTGPSTVEGLSLSTRFRHRIRGSTFKTSVRTRVMVHQVIASIRASTALSFDFVLLICLASMLAAFGLLENSSVIIVASMLVSPLMNPLLGIVFGLSIREQSLWKQGLRNELIGLLVCIACGFLLG